MLDGSTNQEQYVLYKAYRPGYGEQGIFVQLPKRRSSSFAERPEIDWKGTTLRWVHYYPLTEENMALVNQHTDEKPKSPETGPIYWSSIPPAEYAVIGVALASLLGMTATTLRPRKQAPKEPVDDYLGG